MSACLAILRAGRRALGRLTRRSILGAIATASLSLGPVAGQAFAMQLGPTSPSEVSQPANALSPPPLAPPYPDANDPAALGRWFGQTTHLPANSILAITDNAIFAAFPQHTSGALWTVDVRIESITAESTAKLGGRSIHLRLNVRCTDSTVRLSFLDVFPGADLTGAPTHRAPPNDWAKPKPDSYVADAVRLVCDKTFQGPFAAIAPAAPAQRSDPRSHPKSAVDGHAPAPQTNRTPALRARQSLTGAYSVQIGAYSTAELSEGAWRTLKASKPDLTIGLSSAATPVKVGGRVLYRALVKGFASPEAASTFCQTLRTSGRPCLIIGTGAP